MVNVSNMFIRLNKHIYALIEKVAKLVILPCSSGPFSTSMMMGVAALCMWVE